jgi:predicted RND superfamily exporter protein
LVNDQGIINQASLQKIKDLSQSLRMFPGVNKDEIISLATFTQVANTEQGLLIAALLQNVPVSQQELADFREHVRNNPLLWQRLVSEDLTTTLISAPIAKDTPQEDVYQAAIALRNQYQGPEQLYIYGFQIIDQGIEEGIDQDLSLLFPLAIIIIAVLLFFCFLNLRSVFLPILTMVLAVVSTMGIMGWLGFKISTVTSIIPVLIISLGSSYGIHLLERYFSADEDEKITALAKVAKPIILAGITSAIGFFTLIVFKIESLKEFGLFAGLGILFMMFYVLIFCPAFLFILEKNRKSKPEPQFLPKITNHLLIKIQSFSHKTKTVVLLTVGLLVISFWGISKLQVGSNPTEFFPQDHPVRQASQIFTEKFSATGVIEVMFESETEQSVLEPQVLAKIWAFQQYSETLSAVGYTDSIINALRYINLALQGTETIPQTKPLVSQYLLLYGSNRTVDLNMYLDNSQQRLKVTIWMNIDDSQQIEQNYILMQEYLAHNLPAGITVKFGGENMEWIAQNKYIVIGKIVNIIATIIIIFVISAFIFRSLRLGILTILPLSFSTILIFGFMGFLNISLDLASCILTGVTVGVGVDFAIHFINRLLENDLTQENVSEIISKVHFQAGKPIIYDVLSNIFGFSVLLFSSFTPIRDFGWLIILSMISCSLATLVFLPRLIKNVLNLVKEGHDEI